MDDDVFVLLDDCHATALQPTSRLYTGFVREHRCRHPQALDTLWQHVEQDQQAGLHATLCADYEWGCKLQQAGLASMATDDSSALRVLMFSTLEHLSFDGVSQWLAQCDGGETPSPAGVCALQTNTDSVEFDAAIARIRTLISQGETYQVNYTLRMQGLQFGSPVGLYRRLRAMQPVPFGVLAAMPANKTAAAGDTKWVLSASPELFVRHTAGQLTARPMKGTAPRHADLDVDGQTARWLRNDTKNRAENVMIVDLLRNDLGRISDTGTVKVPELFTIETYNTVHQMTSTVTSQMRGDTRFPDVLRALFPCGSITGAPKLHTMDLIAAIEAAPRGLYCGAIGWVDTPVAPASTGDFCMSVAIRTLTLGLATAGFRPFSLGVGSGVVLDSNAHEEFAETQTKARFLTAMDPGFTLFETLRVTHGKYRHLHYHMERLGTSASELGFRFNAQQVRQALDACLASMYNASAYRVRLDLHHNGSITVQHVELTAPTPGPALLVLHDKPVRASEAALLIHKTSLRSDYDAAIQKAVNLGAFDAIFVNTQGAVSEGARSTFFARIDGLWCTPPLASGALAGVMRTRVLRRFRHVAERPLSIEDVLAADALIVCSALRGLQCAQWLKDAAGNVLRV